MSYTVHTLDRFGWVLNLDKFAFITSPEIGIFGPGLECRPGKNDPSYEYLALGTWVNLLNMLRNPSIHFFMSVLGKM